VAAHELAHELIGEIQASGRTAMVQPFHASVDSAGETAVLCIDGAPAHALRKRAVLRPDEVAPVRDDELGAAEIMYDPGLVTADVAAEDELDLAARVVAEIRRRFDYLPLYARVDMIRDRVGAPILLELEAIEPNFYLDQVPATTAIVADAIVKRLPGG
jgi:O-ureido-D-serine cyclo-ligase